MIQDIENFGCPRDGKAGVQRRTVSTALHGTIPVGRDEGYSNYPRFPRSRQGLFSSSFLPPSFPFFGSSTSYHTSSICAVLEYGTFTVIERFVPQAYRMSGRAGGREGGKREREREKTFDIITIGGECGVKK